MATSMTDHPAAAPPPRKGGGGGAILLGLVGLAAVGGGAWFLTHRGQGQTSLPPPSGGCPCPWSNPADAMWHCGLGQTSQTPSGSVDDIAIGHAAFLVQTGQRTIGQVASSFLPGACSVCWDRLPTGCSSC